MKFEYFKNRWLNNIKNIHEMVDEMRSEEGVAPAETQFWVASRRTLPSHLAVQLDIDHSHDSLCREGLRTPFQKLQIMLPRVRDRLKPNPSSRSAIPHCKENRLVHLQDTQCNKVSVSTSSRKSHNLLHSGQTHTLLADPLLDVIHC